jgi:hypothetical protein
LQECFALLVQREIDRDNASDAVRSTGYRT